MSDSEYGMERGIAQILASYGPYNVFDFGRLGVTVRVRPWSGEAFEDIDTDRVAEIVASRAARHRNRTTEEVWADIDEDGVEVFQPSRVEVELYPRVFYCEDCSEVTIAERVDHLPDSGSCHCGGDLNQVSFVNVCRCGKLIEPGPEPCPSDDYQQVELIKVGEEPHTWEYHCGVTGCEEHLGKLYTPCGTCGDEMSGPLPMGSSQIYYSQKAIEVDVPLIGAEERDLPDTERWAKTTIAVHLEKPVFENQSIETVATSEERSESIEESDYSRETVEEVLSEFDFDVPGEGSVGELVDDIEPPEVSSVDVPEGRLAYNNVARQLFTFVRSTRGYRGDEDVSGTRHPKPKSLDAQLAEPGFQDRHPQSNDYWTELERSHVRGAWVVDQFPLLNVLYGYTRGSPRATETDLRKLPHPNYRDGIAVFADRSPSEAIVFEIDRLAIVNWLRATNTFDQSSVAPPPMGADDTQLKEWFVENVSTTELENPFTEVDCLVSERVYTLLHTFSHCLLGRAGEQAGLATGSLGERVFPVVPAIAVYASSTQNFALGSMFTLFKTRLDQWMRDARAQAERCLMDPACREDPIGEAACDACVHVPETSCELFNHRLDRTTLDDPGGVGFWDESIENGID